MELKTKNHKQDLEINQKKFCGYLRKKRNKVGWCKLWFVLQDRLLVSYKSKEDYYNKLVSFKDVINLMPGTQVRPLEGFNFRFTIETTTYVYTFHCDEPDAYRLWISKLLACLTTPKVPLSTMSTRFSSHFSADDLTYACAHAHISHNSFGRIIGAEPNVLSRKSNLEKILERNVDCSLKKQAVKKHIERMNITGKNECKHECYTNNKEEQYSKIIKQNTEELIIQSAKNNDETNIDLENKPIRQDEPVYAVVDLKNKYVQRKKRLQWNTLSRWNSYESIFPTVIEQQEINDQQSEAIYEDGDAYYVDKDNDEDTFITPTKEKEENIYEPINIGEQTAAITLRKYIARLTINPFLRLQKGNRTDFKDNSLKGNNTSKSRFSTIRSKFGAHRKSVQRRIRRFYGNNYEPNPLFQYHNNDANINCSLKEDATEDKQQKINTTENIKEKARTFDSLPLLSKVKIARISAIKTAKPKNESIDMNKSLSD